MVSIVVVEFELEGGIIVSIPSDRVLVSILLSRTMKTQSSVSIPSDRVLVSIIYRDINYGCSSVSIPSDRVLVSIVSSNGTHAQVKSQSPQIGSWFQSMAAIDTQAIADKIGLNPLRSGLGFNIKFLVKEVAAGAGLNPLRSGLGFNRGYVVVDYHKPHSLNPLRSGLGFNRCSPRKQSRRAMASLNPLRSGLGFNSGVRRE